MSVRRGFSRSHDDAPEEHLAGETDARPALDDITSASAGDHLAIYKLLLAVHQRPSHEQFQTELEAPDYLPSNRLLIRRGDGIIAHVLLAPRSIYFGAATLPAFDIQWLTALPEFYSDDLNRRILLAAEQKMRDQGAVVAMIHTASPERLAPLGWVECGRASYLRVPARKVLAQLPQARREAAAATLSTRMWRQVEMRALMQVYDQHMRGQFGPVERDESYWRWLIARHAQGQIVVSVEGDDTLDFDSRAPAIVGYAVVDQEHLVELLFNSQPMHVLVELLARVCRDAIERDHDVLYIHARPGTELYELLQRAGGTSCRGPQPAGAVLMAKVLDSRRLLRQLLPELQRRAGEGGLPRSCELPLVLDGTPHRLTLTPRSVHLAAASETRPEMACGRWQFAQLLLGQFDHESLSDAIQFRTKRTRGIVRALFPRVTFWRSPLDGLHAH